MKRFLIGLLFGACAALITWTACGDAVWTAVAGALAAAAVWGGKYIADNR